jgi:hypothetical protein
VLCRTCHRDKHKAEPKVAVVSYLRAGEPPSPWYGEITWNHHYHSWLEAAAEIPAVRALRHVRGSPDVPTSYRSPRASGNGCAKATRRAGKLTRDSLCVFRIL